MLIDENEVEQAAAVSAEDDTEEAQDEAPVSVSALKTDFLKKLNPNSLEVCHGYLESYLSGAQAGDTFQFLRMGYYCKDTDSTAEMPVFNRVVGLKDTLPSR